MARRKDGRPHTVAEFIDKALYSLVDDFVHKCPKKKLCELHDINQTGKYIVVANITALKLDPTWYYLSCNKCLGGVVEDDGEDLGHESGNKTKIVGKWKCNKCKLRGIDVVRRFRIQIRVQHSTAAVSLTLFDRDVFGTIQKTAEEIYAHLPQGEEDDTIPSEMHVLVGRVYAFKIDISDYTIKRRNQVYTVSKMTNSKEVLDALITVPHQKSVTNSETAERSVLTEESVSPSTSGKRPLVDNEVAAIDAQPINSKKPLLSPKKENP